MGGDQAGGGHCAEGRSVPNRTTRFPVSSLAINLMLRVAQKKNSVYWKQVGWNLHVLRRSSVVMPRVSEDQGVQKKFPGVESQTGELYSD